MLQVQSRYLPQPLGEPLAPAQPIDSVPNPPPLPAVSDIWPPLFSSRRTTQLHQTFAGMQSEQSRALGETPNCNIACRFRRPQIPTPVAPSEHQKKVRYSRGTKSVSSQTSNYEPRNPFRIWRRQTLPVFGTSSTHFEPHTSGCSR